MTHLSPAVNRNGTPHYRMFIAGEWVDTEDHFDVVNPATEEITATAAKARIDHVDAAVAAARSTRETGMAIRTRRHLEGASIP
ncbi:hypothetical protein V1Y59_11235 [Gordonia sp. PKS22-38]|uniref:Aldehyde dehydrogenase family protein n=1 Tax=Gordonia prachuapensis TaxID=3115651 RepID=A0ABU7MTK2_9ACTN|nr:hypothetical protein [Gordonia sp. PKS22-38]